MGTGNIEKQDFDFGEQGKNADFSGEQWNRYPHPTHPPGRSSFLKPHHFEASVVRNSS